jgi:ABC-type uncharacterized transport system permease subunit
MKKLLGKLSDLWTIPLALIVAVCYNYISSFLGLFSMTPEKIGKIIPGTVIFLLALGISRIVHMVQYPDTFVHGLMKNENKSWNDLPNDYKFLYSWLQRAILFLGLVLILGAM